jgi:WXG100 family type VII secretion target
LASTFGTVDTLASGIDSQVRKIESELESLKSQIQNLETIWEGAAGGGFQQIKNNWFTSAADLNGVLNRIATAVHAANSAYQETEHKNASSWGA